MAHANAAEQVLSRTDEQTCWVIKRVNPVDQLLPLVGVPLLTRKGNFLTALALIRSVQGHVIVFAAFCATFTTKHYSNL
jgi:hypothetical protein